MAELSDLLVARKPGTSSTDDAYANWRADPTPENMKAVLDDLDTTINSEIQRFSGPKPLLRSKARALAVKAVRSYDPAGGTRLRSWVVTQLQPLSRYNNSLKPIYAPEDVSRKAYAISKARETLLDETGREPTDEELADRVGISVKRLGKIRGAVPAVVNETMGEDDDDDASPDLPVYQANAVQAASEAVYDGLDERDRLIFDLRTGGHGKQITSGTDIAAMLKVSPAAVTLRANAIAQRILDTKRRMEQ